MLLSENYVSLKESVGHFQRAGIRTTYNTVLRWVNVGIKGVRLRTVRYGGRRFLTEETIQEFNAALAEAEGQTIPAKQGNEIGRRELSQRFGLGKK